MYGKTELVENLKESTPWISSPNNQVLLEEPRQNLKIYVDIGVRFLGEVNGNNFITYSNLKNSIETNSGKSVGSLLNLGNDSGVGGRWLKFYDIRTNKVLYIAKKPMTYRVSWLNLYEAGVLYGLDKVHLGSNKSKTINNIDNLGDYKPQVIDFKGRKFIVRSLKGLEVKNKKIVPNTENITEHELNQSEWNRYMLPIIQVNRLGLNYLDKYARKYVEKSIEPTLAVKKSNIVKIQDSEEYALQIARYTWLGDLTLGDTYSPNIRYKGQKTLVQETTERQNYTRGYGNTIAGGAAFTLYDITSKGDNDDDAEGEIGFRPVLEEIPQNCYDGACFEGEVAGTDFITYRKLLENIEWKSYEDFTTTTIPIENYDSIEPQEMEVKKTKVGNELALGNDTEAGGNWLKIHDYKEGKTLYIAKKPLTNYVSWDDLFNAGVVYGLDQIDTSKEALKEFKTTKKLKMSKNYTGKSGYTPKTVEIGGKNYIVRLLKGHTTDSTIHKNGDPNAYSSDNYDKLKNVKNSEWNRYILPLVKDYRYSFISYVRIEDDLEYLTDNTKEDYLTQPSLSKDNKNFKIQLAEYNWFGDLTLRPARETDDDIFYYKGKEQKFSDSYIKNLPEYVGQYTWTQEHAERYKSNSRISRGSAWMSLSASFAETFDSNSNENEAGFRPVLEEIPNN